MPTRQAPPWMDQPPATGMGPGAPGMGGFGADNTMGMPGAMGGVAPEMGMEQMPSEAGAGIPPGMEQYRDLAMQIGMSVIQQILAAGQAVRGGGQGPLMR